MVVVIGEALIDRITDPSGAVHDIVGGGPFNAARALARLGQPTAFTGGVSTDALGQRIAGELEAVGVAALLPPRSQLTGVAHAVIDASGSARYRFELADAACSQVTAKDVRAVWPETAPQAVHVGTLGLVLQPLASAVVAVVDSLADSTLLFVDPNCRPGVIDNPAAYQASVRHVLSRADVVKVSDEDLAFLAPAVDTLAAARALHAASGALVLLTQGSAGVWVLGHGFEDHVRATPVAVVDTVGAGDVFGAAWLAWWLSHGFGRMDVTNKAAVLEAVHYSTRAAAWTCGRLGAQVPSVADLMDM